MSQIALEHRGPLHVAIIMDGNGRWATTRGLPRTAGHVRGADAERTAGEAYTAWMQELATRFPPPQPAESQP